jgi:ubiquinone/menaquinone biosynthesis C-methylase UbiE
MNANALAFSIESFDLITISNSIHHFNNYTNILDKMVTTLKSDGHILINEMVSDKQTETQMTHVLLHHWWGEIDTECGIVHHPTFSQQNLIEMNEHALLKTIDVQEITNLDENPTDTETIDYL